jgi:hypothetical protein
VLWVYHFCHFLLSVKRLLACDFLDVYTWSFASMSHRSSKVPGKWRRKKTTACHPFCCSCRNSILWSITLLQLCVSNYLYVNSCYLPLCSSDFLLTAICVLAMFQIVLWTVLVLFIWHFYVVYKGGKCHMMREINIE